MSSCPSLLMTGLWDERRGGRHVTNSQGNGIQYNKGENKVLSTESGHFRLGLGGWLLSRALKPRVGIFKRRRKSFQTGNTIWAPVKLLEHSRFIYWETVHPGVASTGALSKCCGSWGSKWSLEPDCEVHSWMYHSLVLEKLHVDLGLKYWFPQHDLGHLGGSNLFKKFVRSKLFSS